MLHDRLGHGPPLTAQFLPKRLLLERHVIRITLRIDERTSFAGLQTGMFCGELVVISMRSQEDVAGKTLEPAECRRIVGGNRRIRRVPHELIARVHIWAANHHDIQRCFLVGGPPAPGSAAGCMSRRAMGGQGHSAQSDLLAVFEHTVDRAGEPALVGVKVLTFSPLANDLLIPLHHQHLGSRQFLEPRMSRHMIGVGVAVEDVFDIGRLEAEGLHGVADQRHRFLKTAVDQDVTVGGGDEIRREILRADVVGIVGDLVRGEGPVRTAGACADGEQDGEAGTENAREHGADSVRKDGSANKQKTVGPQTQVRHKPGAGKMNPDSDSDCESELLASSSRRGGVGDDSTTPPRGKCRYFFSRSSTNLLTSA